MGAENKRVNPIGTIESAFSKCDVLLADAAAPDAPSFARVRETFAKASGYTDDACSEITHCYLADLFTTKPISTLKATLKARLEKGGFTVALPYPAIRETDTGFTHLQMIIKYMEVI